jgi:hypothetical protein
MLRTAAENAATPRQARKRLSQPKPTASTGRPGRPHGRQHREPTPRVLSPARPRLHTRLQPPLSVINGLIPLRSPVWDGHFGHPLAWHRGRGGG